MKITTDKYEIHLGDCLELMKSLPDNSVDMVFADLPYGTTKNKWDTHIDLKKLWEQYNRICKPNAAILLSAQTPFDKVLGASNLKMLRYEWIWEKTQPTGHLNAKKMPMKCHENILVFYKELPVYNPIKTQGHARKVSTAEHKRNSKKTTNWGEYGLASYDSTERYPRDVLKFPKDTQKEALSPTQKPVALSTYFINTYTNPGSVVLDNTMGSGSTGISCLEIGRYFMGMELDPEEFNKAKNRIENYEKTN